VSVDLFIKKLPNVVKELIGREALDNRRSVNQEAIALLEEALLGRVGAAGRKRRSVQNLLEEYAARRTGKPDPTRRADAPPAPASAPQGSREPRNQIPEPIPRNDLASSSN
jgi:Arc-like DNA binding domain